MALERIRPKVVDETQDYVFNNVTATGNLTTFNADLGNLATANYIFGTLLTTSQPNITSVGSLTSLDVVGVITAGIVSTDSLTYANGNPWSLGDGLTIAGTSTQIQFNDNSSLGASANFTFDKTSNTLVVDNIVASGSGLSNITASNINGQVANSLLAGTVYSSAQPNITSVGTLTSVTISGNLTSGNANLGNLSSANYFSGSGNLLANLQGANVSGEVGYAAIANAVAGANVIGAVTYAATANAVAGANVFGQVGNSLIAGTVTASAQSNITSVGTLTSLAVSGNVDLGNIANVHILGGNANFILRTDGTGNLSWSDLVLPSLSVSAAVQSFSANGVQTTFVLSTAPSDANLVTVNYDGVVLLKSDYTLTGANVIFATAPANGSTVEVSVITSSGSNSSGSSGSPSGYTWNISNSNITMSVSNGYFVDTSSGAKTMTLPATAVLGDSIRINDLSGTFASNNLTVAHNGNNIEGVAEDLVVDYNKATIELVYSNSTGGWKVMGL